MRGGNTPVGNGSPENNDDMRFWFGTCGSSGLDFFCSNVLSRFSFVVLGELKLDRGSRNEFFVGGGLRKFKRKALVFSFTYKFPITYSLLFPLLYLAAKLRIKSE
jgi:hypothetical protein